MTRAASEEIADKLARERQLRAIPVGVIDLALLVLPHNGNVYVCEPDEDVDSDCRVTGAGVLECYVDDAWDGDGEVRRDVLWLRVRTEHGDEFCTRADFVFRTPQQVIEAWKSASSGVRGVLRAVFEHGLD